MEKAIYIKQEALHSVFLTKQYLGDQIMKNEMGGACDMYGGQVRGIYGFGGETWCQETTWKT